MDCKWLQMDELVRDLQGRRSGGGFASDLRAPAVWRWLRWPAEVGGYDVRANWQTGSGRTGRGGERQRHAADAGGRELGLGVGTAPWA